jgi:hypothetical protein
MKERSETADEEGVAHEDDDDKSNRSTQVRERE